MERTYTLPKTNNRGFISKLSSKKKFGHTYGKVVKNNISASWYVPNSLKDVMR